VRSDVPTGVPVHRGFREYPCTGGHGASLRRRDLGRVRDPEGREDGG
jgi:hypothetical protein